MVPTLQIGQRVLVNRIGNRFSDPKVGDIIVFHPPKGSDTDDQCGDGNRRQGQACDKPTRHAGGRELHQARRRRARATRSTIKDGHVYRNGKREKEPLHQPHLRDSDGRGLQLHQPRSPSRPTTGS